MFICVYTGRQDNGRGSARLLVFQHNHEVCSGITSSISQHNLYFNSYGEVINFNKQATNTTSDTNTTADSTTSATTMYTTSTSKSNILKSHTDTELIDHSTRIVSFIDLAGHSKYLKTTLHGLLVREPDHCLLCVSAKRGVQAMTTEHLGVAFALKLPLGIHTLYATIILYIYQYNNYCYLYYYYYYYYI